MCDALDRNHKPCPRPSDWHLLIETTGQRLGLCDFHANQYDKGEAVRYAPKNGGQCDSSGSPRTGSGGTPETGPG